MSAVSACRRTSGLALNATPSPATASMSRSLAPSPIATVRLSGSPSERGELPQRRGLPFAVDDPADDPAGEVAVDDLEPVGAHVVDTELVGEGRTTSMKPPETSRHGEAEALEGAHEGAGARGEAHGIPHLVEHGLGQPGERRDAGVQALREVELAAHRRVGDRRPPRRPRPAWSASSSMTSSWMSVESTSMTTSRPPAPREPGGGHRDVGSHGVRDQREVVAQVGDVGARDVELHGRHRVARQAADAVDVRTVLGDRGSHGRDLVRLERSPHDDDRRPAGPARGVVTATDLEVHPHPHALAGPDEAVDEDVLVAARREQDGEGEVAPDDDLLEVEDLRTDRRGRLEQRLRDARAVRAVERDEQRPLLGVRQRRRGRLGCGD